MGEKKIKTYQVVQPSNHDRFVIRCQDCNELVLEELVAVEEHIIGKPGACRRKQSGSEVGKCHLERLCVVARDMRLPLRDHQLFARRSHLKITVVNQPEGTHGWDSKRDAIRPLGSHFGIGRVATSMVEDEEQEDKDDLVEELAPPLHQEGTGNLPATVETVVLR